MAFAMTMPAYQYQRPQDWGRGVAQVFRAMDAAQQQSADRKRAELQRQAEMERRQSLGEALAAAGDDPEARRQVASAALQAGDLTSYEAAIDAAADSQERRDQMFTQRMDYERFGLDRAGHQLQRQKFAYQQWMDQQPPDAIIDTAVDPQGVDRHVRLHPETLEVLAWGPESRRYDPFGDMARAMRQPRERLQVTDEIAMGFIDDPIAFAGESEEVQSAVLAYARNRPDTFSDDMLKNLSGGTPRGEQIGRDLLTKARRGPLTEEETRQFWAAFPSMGCALSMEVMAAAGFQAANNPNCAGFEQPAEQHGARAQDDPRTGGVTAAEAEAAVQRQGNPPGYEELGGPPLRQGRQRGSAGRRP